MNHQEAKFILQAYRHNGADAKDPHFREALAQVERDPELASWLKDDQKLFHQARLGLSSVPIPPDLKANIMAGGRIIRPKTWWRRPAVLAAAAVLALLLTWAGFLPPRSQPNDYASFREAMSDYLDNKLTRLDEESKEVDILKNWLAGSHAPSQIELPSGLRRLPSIGCKVLDYHGNKVSLICFRDGGTLVHLFVMDQPDWQELPSVDHPQLTLGGSWNTAGWATGHQAYLLASKAPEYQLRRYL